MWTARHQDLVVFTGDKTITYPTALKLHHRFDEEERDVKDQLLLNQTIIEATSKNIERAERIIEHDPHMTFDDIEARALLSRTTIFVICVSSYRGRK